MFRGNKMISNFNFKFQPMETQKLDCGHAPKDGDRYGMIRLHDFVGFSKTKFMCIDCMNNEKVLRETASYLALVRIKTLAYKTVKPESKPLDLFVETLDCGHPNADTEVCEFDFRDCPRDLRESPSFRHLLGICGLCARDIDKVDELVKKLRPHDHKLNRSSCEDCIQVEKIMEKISRTIMKDRLRISFPMSQFQYQ